MNIKAIHHIAIICSDYETSKHFYTEVLGLPVIRESYRQERASYKLDLSVGDSQIELFSFPDPPLRLTQPEARGLRHLAFAVNHMEESIGHLERFGVFVEPVRIDKYTGRRYTFFKDPDGLPLELYEE